MSQVLGVLFDPGELEAAAEFSTKDRDAAGSVDFVDLLNSFVTSMLEVRMLFCHSDDFCASPKLVSMLSRAFAAINGCTTIIKCIRLGRPCDYGSI